MDNEQLVTRIQAGEDVAGNMLKLWEQNRGFIGKTARRYSAGAEMEDLEQEGYIALCEAAWHYDVTRGAPFISYAAFWLKRRMRDCVDNNQPVRLSANAEEEVREYRKIVREYRQEYGCEPSEWELCGLLRISREKLDHTREAAQMGNIRSLDEPLPGIDEDVSLGDTVASGEDMEEDTIREIDRERMKREVWLAVDDLPDKQAGAIRLRFVSGATLKELGECLGVTTERARGIQNKAMSTLRQRAPRYKYRHYFEEYLTAAPVHHVSMQRFRDTWTSEVEQEAIRWAEKELGYIR